jgi:hypothetical protein
MSGPESKLLTDHILSQRDEGSPDSKSAPAIIVMRRIFNRLLGITSPLCKMLAAKLVMHYAICGYAEHTSMQLCSEPTGASAWQQSVEHVSDMSGC